MKTFLARKWPELLFAGLALVILGPMLRPGYVFLMDMVFVPTVRFFKDYGTFYNSYPFQALLWLAAQIMPVWVAQKIMLLGLFSAIGISAYHFLPLPPAKVPRVFSALLYLANPFVYWRFLAGNIFLLWGYALLPAVLDSMLRVVREPSPRNGLRLGIFFGILVVISLHLAVPVAFVLAAVACMRTVRAGPQRASLLKAWGTAAAVAVALSAYWILPYLWERPDVAFDPRHWEAFAPASPDGHPVLAELATLHGFWAQARPWGAHFASFRELPSFRVAYALLAGLALAGIIHLLRTGRRTMAYALLATGACSIVLASGVADTPFRGFNGFLAGHLPFWSGLRDSQKLIAFLALAYAVSAAWGLELVRERVRAPVGTALVGALFIVPLMLGSLQWWGMHGQVRPSWYPDSWYALDARMQQDPPGVRTVFLPWYRYMYFRFTGMTVDNPARFFFGPEAVVSMDIGLDGIRDQESDPYYRSIDRIISDDSLSPDQGARALAELGIVRLVVFKEPVVDVHTYPFLASRLLIPESENGEFMVYSFR